MHRPRILVLLIGLAAAIAVGPLLGPAALAADPTVVVRPGDTLTAIARRVSVPAAELVRLNALPNPNRIFAGQTLRIGTDASAATAPVPQPEQASAAAPGTAVHVVQRGENLTTIARRYGVTVAALVAANGISNPSRIYGGQSLTVPGVASAQAAPQAAPAFPAAPAPPAAPPSATAVHVVQRGENLTTIARRYGVTVAALAAANGISNPSRIIGGQRLTVPGAAAAPAPAAPAASPGTAAPAMPPSMVALVTARQTIRQIILEEAARFAVPGPLALAVAWQESGWQQGVVSSAGAVGVMQLMPATASWVSEAMLRAPVNMHDTRDNVRAGVRLLAHYLERYQGNRDLVLAAYYQGQRAADMHGVFGVTRPYIASILVLERLFGG